MICLKDGGVLIITDEQKEKWEKIYPKANLDKVLNELKESGIFGKCTQRKALKLINEYLMKENKGG